MTSIKIGLLSLTVQRIRGLAMESSGKYSMAGSKYRENGPWAKECGQPLKAGESHGRNVSRRDVLILASWTSHPQIINSPFQAVNLWQLVIKKESEALPDLTPVPQHLVCLSHDNPHLAAQLPHLRPWTTNLLYQALPHPSTWPFLTHSGLSPALPEERLSLTLLEHSLLCCQSIPTSRENALPFPASRSCPTSFSCAQV